MGYDIVSLGDLISRYQERDGDLDRLTSYLCTFSCTRNTDLEIFLHERAIPNEKKDLTRTYLAVSEDRSILGYFSLNLRCGIVPPGSVSRSLYKKLNVQEDTNVAQMYLIAQLGRDDERSEPGFGRDLIIEAMDVIRKAKDLVGCRVVRLDCRPDPNLIGYYHHYGFQEIKKDTNGDDLMMMVMILKDTYDWENHPES